MIFDLLFTWFIGDLQLLAGDPPQLLVLVVVEDVPRVVVPDVRDEVVPVLVVHLGGDAHDALEDARDPLEVAALHLPLDVPKVAKM